MFNINFKIILYYIIKLLFIFFIFIPTYTFSSKNNLLAPKTITKTSINIVNSFGGKILTYNTLKSLLKDKQISPEIYFKKLSEKQYIPIEDMLFIHATDFFPENGIIKTTFESTDEALYFDQYNNKKLNAIFRNKIHCGVNHLSSNHNEGLSSKKYKILIPSPKNISPYNFNISDTAFLGNIIIEKAYILMSEKEAKELKSIPSNITLITTPSNEPFTEEKIIEIITLLEYPYFNINKFSSEFDENNQAFKWKDAFYNHFQHERIAEENTIKKYGFSPKVSLTNDIDSEYGIFKYLELDLLYQYLELLTISNVQGKEDSDEYFNSKYHRFEKYDEEKLHNKNIYNYFIESLKNELSLILGITLYLKKGISSHFSKETINYDFELKNRDKEKLLKPVFKAINISLKVLKKYLIDKKINNISNEIPEEKYIELYTLISFINFLLPENEDIKELLEILSFDNKLISQKDIKIKIKNNFNNYLSNIPLQYKITEDHPLIISDYINFLMKKGENTSLPQIIWQKLIYLISS